MIVYEKPRYYILIHILIGCIAVWFPLIGVLALIWQFGQYTANVRIFADEGRIETGNSIEHTAVKLAEIGVGTCIGILLYTIYNEKSSVDVAAVAIVEGNSYSSISSSSE
jgi:hypothetical protein